MAELPTPDADGYVGGNSQACHAQFIEFVEADSSSRDSESDLYRAFAFEIASQVGGRYCRHVEEPPALEDMSLAKKKKAAANHPGLCGVHHAAVIAGVKTQDVVDKWGTTTANKYRNQACFDGAVALNARGAGVQLPRAQCFAEACGALWPGGDEMPACVIEVFSL
ncbi:unnamed protein product [Pylaiella littoralis]